MKYRVSGVQNAMMRKMLGLRRERQETLNAYMHQTCAQGRLMAIVRLNQPDSASINLTHQVDLNNIILV